MIHVLGYILRKEEDVFRPNALIRYFFNFFVSLFASALCGQAYVFASPIVVETGIYLNNIPSVNLKEKKFQVDFNIWFRWKGGEIDPIETMEIFNGSIDTKDGLVKKNIDGVNYAVQRVHATIFRNFDVARYPLDDHTLKIQIEDSKLSAREMVYVADTTNASVSSKITVPGWNIGKFEGYQSITRYNTNYGDISVAKDSEATFPRYTFAVDLKRPGFGYFFKYFSILFLAAVVTFSAFWISAGLIDTRYWLVTSGFFMAAFTGSSLSTILPETESFGLGDLLYNMTMGFILVAMLVMIYSHKVFPVDEARAHRLSRFWGFGLSGLYVICGALIVKVA